MYFRDFRHQLEPDEQKLTAQLELARERFFTNLSLLQLQLPELAQQLRVLTPTTYILAVDRDGVGHCIHTERLSMQWPPLQFMRDYAPLPEDLAIIAAELEDSGGKLVPHLTEQSAPYILLYVKSLEWLYASLHFTDWLPLLHTKTLFIQLHENLTEATAQHPFKNDLSTLASHGIATKPFVFIEPVLQVEPFTLATSAEHRWHFEQSLQHNHDCDPVLRRQTHKFSWQLEFQLQNNLINKARQQPMRLPEQGWTLILCGVNPAIYHSAALLPRLQRIILLDTKPIAKELLDVFQQQGIQVHCCIGAVKETASLFLHLLNQLPAETAWFCRLYQAGVSVDAQQLRQRVELELRYRVQPAMGIKRCLVAAAQASALPQYMLTRRTIWPTEQGQKLPLLLLGNGPSLATTLTAIQQGQAQGYLLVSCGTTLATLYHHNITPHIHLELELASNIFKPINKEYLAKIHFIAPLGFQHQTREYFGSHSSFISDSHPVDELVPGLPDDTIRVVNAFPTVLNLGVALAAHMGAEQLWLAGFDLAFDNMHNHHAKGSVYDQSDASQYVQKSGELIAVTTIDGEPALTKREFQLAAFQTQDMLQRFTNMKAYQLCHGLDLGAEPRQQLAPQRSTKAVAFTHSCTKVQVNWQKISHACHAQPYLELFVTHHLDNASLKHFHLLQQPLLSLGRAKRMRMPAELWSEGLKRNLAALLLRLELNSLTELPEAHALFTAMLADLAPHEASIL